MMKEVVKGVRVPCRPEHKWPTGSLVSYFIHSSVLERATRTFWLLWFLSHRLTGSRFAPSARVSHRKTWELVTFTCKPRNALLICIWRQINFRKIEWVSCLVFAFFQHVLLPVMIRCRAVKFAALHKYKCTKYHLHILFFFFSGAWCEKSYFGCESCEHPCLQQPTYTP